MWRRTVAEAVGVVFLESSCGEDDVSQDLNQPNRQASIAYLARVLGVERVLLPPQDVAPAAGESDVVSESSVAVSTSEVSKSVTSSGPSSFGPSSARLVFLVPQAHLEDEELRKLWANMVRAMKQEPEKVWIVGAEVLGSQANVWDQLALASRSAVVILGEHAAESAFAGQEWMAARWLEPRPNLPVFVTHGLDKISNDIDLKRSAWQHLQMVMKRLT